jgi:ATP-dependent Clp protease ATP-binding subunit ClpC
MEDELRHRVVAQDEALTSVARAIRRARSGLKDPARPIGSFIFLGPTGVGKTELAKALAQFLFGEEDALVRIDMSEYMEKYSVSRLLGAPPGYVGYEEGGQLTEKVRKRPYAVVLLDEIEKAHPDVFSLLLQVFDDGRLTDSWGHVVDFRNTVIILTSNVGTRRVRRGGTMGFGGGDEAIDYDTMRERVLAEVRKTFNPEFLNRLDELIVFRPLQRQAIEQIIDILMGRVNKRLEDRKIHLTLDADTKEFLVSKGYDPEYGARPLRRTLQRYLEDPLSQLLLEGSIPDDTEIATTLEGEQVRFHIVEKALAGAGAGTGTDAAEPS